MKVKVSGTPPADQNRPPQNLYVGYSNWKCLGIATEENSRKYGVRPPTDFIGLSGKNGTVYTTLYFIMETTLPDSSSLRLLYPLNVSKAYSVIGSSITLINDSAQTIRVKLPEGITPEVAGTMIPEIISQEIENLKVNKGPDAAALAISRLESFIQTNARVALKGEKELYDLLMVLSRLPKHGRAIYVGGKRTEETYKVSDFVLGGNPAPAAAHEVFHRIVDGDIDLLDKELQSPRGTSGGKLFDGAVVMLMYAKSLGSKYVPALSRTIVAAPVSDEKKWEDPQFQHQITIKSEDDMGVEQVTTTVFHFPPYAGNPSYLFTQIQNERIGVPGGGIWYGNYKLQAFTPPQVPVNNVISPEEPEEPTPSADESIVPDLGDDLPF